MSSLTVLEFSCAVIMLTSALSTVLMVYAALAIEQERRALATLHQHRVKAAYRAHTFRRLLALTYRPALTMWPVEVVVI